MKKLFLIPILLLLAGLAFFVQFTKAQDSLGTAPRIFLSEQVGASPANTFILQTNGTDSTWVDPSSVVGGSGGSNWKAYRSDVNIITPTTSGASILVNSSTSTITNLSVERATSTKSLYVGASSLAVLEGGKIGIGTVTPGAKLDVVMLNDTNYALALDQYSATDTTGPYFVFQKSHQNTAGNTVTVSGERLGEFQFSGNTGSGFSVAANIRVLQDGAFSTTIPGALTFLTANGSTAATERMRIDKSGNVGIGTTTPWGKLAIASFNQDATPLFTIASSTGSGVTTTALMIDSAGNVGINTTNPLNKLDVTGNINASGHVYGADFYANSSAINTLIYSFTNRHIVLSPGTNGNVGIGTTTPYARLSISSYSQDLTPLFVVASSTGSSATTSALKVDWVGRVSVNGEQSSGREFTVNGVSNFSRGGQNLEFNPNYALGNVYGAFDMSTGKDFSLQTNSISRMYIKAAGNIGVGTTTPQASLAVAPSAGVITTAPLFLISSTTQPGIESDILNINASGSYATTTVAGYFQVASTSNSAATPVLQITPSGQPFGESTTTVVGFFQVASSTSFGHYALPAVYVDPQALSGLGAVGLGIAAPTSTLQVNGDFNAMAKATTSKLVVGSLNNPTINLIDADLWAGRATTTNLAISLLKNCDTINTDANGSTYCGTDATGSGVNPWNAYSDMNLLEPTNTIAYLGIGDFSYKSPVLISRSGIKLQVASSTALNIQNLGGSSAFTVNTNATSTNATTTAYGYFQVATSTNSVSTPAFSVQPPVSLTGGMYPTTTAYGYFQVASSSASLATPVISVNPLSLGLLSTTTIIGAGVFQAPLAVVNTSTDAIVVKSQLSSALTTLDTKFRVDYGGEIFASNATFILNATTTGMLAVGASSSNFISFSSTNSYVATFSGTAKPWAFINMQAQGMIPTQGDSGTSTTSRTAVLYTTNRVMTYFIDFPSSTPSNLAPSAQGHVVMGNNYDGGKIRAQLNYTASSTTGNAKLCVKGFAVASGTPAAIDGAWGTAQCTSALTVATANQLNYSTTTPDITLGGSPGAGATVYLYVYRQNNDDNRANYLRVQDVKLWYQLTSLGQ